MSDGLFLKKIRYIFILLCSLFFIACSGEPPVVSEVWWQLNVEEDFTGEGKTESLSLFLNGEDKDGDEDLETLYIINDEKQYFWEIPSDEWVQHTEQNTKWIGLNGILAPGDGHFPEGEYRVLLIDRAGERDETTFYLRNLIPPLEELESPEISYDNNRIKVETEFPLFQIWFYNDRNELVEKSQSFSPGNYDWNQISRNIVRRSRTFTLYMEPESGAWGSISRSYSFSE